MSGTWNRATTTRLLQLSSAGRTASEIAATMGITRNAVLGKLWRLGQRQKTKKGRAARVASKRQNRRTGSNSNSPRVSRPPCPDPRPAPVDPGLSLAVPLAEVRDGQCRFPVWPDDAHRSHPDYGKVCGAAKCDHSPAYCAYHTEIVAPERAVKLRAWHNQKAAAAVDDARKVGAA